MGIMIVLDTSAIIEILDGTAKGMKIKEMIREKEVCTTAFSIYELLVPAIGEEKASLELFLANFKVFSYDYASARKSSELQKEMSKKGMELSRVDMFIASICLTRNISLLTLDKDFKRISGLKVISV